MHPVAILHLKAVLYCFSVANILFTDSDLVHQPVKTKNLQDLGAGGGGGCAVYVGSDHCMRIIPCFRWTLPLNHEKKTVTQALRQSKKKGWFRLLLPALH